MGYHAGGKIKVQDRKLQLQRSLLRPWRGTGLLAAYVCVALACPPDAFAASNSVIWERGDQIVQLAKQDDVSATPNDHPASVERGEIKAMLESLRFRYADEEPGSVSVPVFTRTDIDNLGKALATALDQATPSQDIIFHVISARRISSGAFTRRNRVCAGRVFYRDGKLNIIFGQVQSPYRKKNVYGQISEDFYPRNYGSRTAATKHDVVLLQNETASLYQSNGVVRNDWLVMRPGVVAPPKPSTTTSAVATETASGGPSEETIAPSSAAENVEERLQALKQLRERELISEDAYQAKMKEILQDL